MAGQTAASGVSSGYGVADQNGGGGDYADVNTDDLGVAYAGTYPDRFNSIILSRHEAAEENVRRIFDNYAERVLIQTSNYPVDGVAFYDPKPQERGVYFNAEADANNPRGAGTTYFHEIGHMIDNALLDYSGYLSDEPMFLNALMQDGLDLLVKYSKMDSEQRAYTDRFLFRDECHSLSDLVDAITKGKLSGKYGHDRDYWDDRSNISKEAFAHFFEAAMGGGEKKTILSECFPRATKVFDALIASLLPKVKTQSLSKTWR